MIEGRKRLCFSFCLKRFRKKDKVMYHLTYDNPAYLYCQGQTLIIVENEHEVNRHKLVASVLHSNYVIAEHSSSVFTNVWIPPNKVIAISTLTTLHMWRWEKKERLATFNFVLCFLVLTLKLLTNLYLLMKCLILNQIVLINFKIIFNQK
jgi:hypothetical protein